MTQELILVLNRGSPSLKGAVLDNDSSKVLLGRLAERLNLPDAYVTFKFNGEKHKIDLSAKPDHTGAVETLMEELKAHGLDTRIGTIGHRVVSGGELYSESILVTNDAITGIGKCIPLAPLHDPAHLLGPRAAQATLKGLLNVIVFDTTFRQAMPKHTYKYAVPRGLYEKYSLRRHGARGASYRFVADGTAHFPGKDKKDLRMVIIHLGDGTSVTTVANSQSQDTSMGLTPLGDLVMGARSSDIDPAVFSFLAENISMTISQITEMLNKKSGLLGISGLSNDCRTTGEKVVKGYPGAELALKMFIYRLAKYIGSMTVTIGGLDALVFTGGIGENSDIIREHVLGYLDFLGLRIDREASLEARFGNAGVITTVDSRTVAVVIPTSEELMIVHDTAHLSGL